MENEVIALRKENYQKSLAKNLSTLRTKLSLSQEELANKVGTSRHTISLIERGAREMMWDTCLSLTFLFVINSETRALMQPLGIDVDLISEYLNISNSEFKDTEVREEGIGK